MIFDVFQSSHQDQALHHGSNANKRKGKEKRKKKERKKEKTRSPHLLEDHFYSVFERTLLKSMTGSL